MSASVLQNPDQSDVRILLTCGDPNGIGPEVLLRALVQMAPFQEWIPSIMGPVDSLRAALRVVDESDLDIDRNVLTVGGSRVPIIDPECRWNPQPGVVAGDAGRASAEAVIQGTRRVLAGEFDGIVTMPISKEAWEKGGDRWPGHTELISSLCEATGLMILMTDELRVALLTGHMPLESVAAVISEDLIMERSRTLHRTLRQDFGLSEPRISVLGLNPHAGDGGVLGSEEEDVYRPALAKLHDEGVIADGPYPADAFFARRSWETSDAVLASYHDQGLIPLKMLARGEGVNFTAGLPIVRTSPDHGTAFDIAGKGSASGQSAVAAIYAAITVVRNRRAVSRMA